MAKRSWFRELFIRPVTHKNRKALRRTRLALEPLESRWCLSAVAVNNLTDVVDGDTSNIAALIASPGTDGSISLREALTAANNTAGADTIGFDNTVFSTLKTITLSGGQLTLSDTTGATTITGPAAGVSVSGNNTSRVFQIDGLVTASISGMTITGGNAGSGGGVNNAGTLAMTNCTVSGNTATGYFGGVGGGVNNGGTLAMTNCTVSGNSASGSYGGFGGGVNNGVGATLALTNCTVSGNTTTGSFNGGHGGGVSNGGGATLTNTIVAVNTGGGDIYGGFSGANNLIGGNPLLGPLANNGGPTKTMALLPGSPAIDAGSDSVLGSPLYLTADQRGLPFVRKAGAHVDIGAYEFQTTLTISAADATYTGSPYLESNVTSTLTPSSAVGTITYSFFADAAGMTPIADPTHAGTYYVQGHFASSDFTQGTNADSPIVGFTINKATLTGVATTQSALNIAKQGYLNVDISSIAGIEGSDTIASVFGSMTYQLTIGANVYTFQPTVTVVSSTEVNVAYTLKGGTAAGDALRTDLALIDLGATSASKASIETLWISAQNQDYTFVDDFFTRLFNSTK